MTKENLIKFRDEAHTNSQVLIIYLDNGRFVSEGTSFVKWNDTSELLTIVEANASDAYSQINAPMQITVVDYDCIQSLNALYMANSKLETSLSVLGFSSTEIAKVMTFANKVHSISDVYDKYSYTTSNPETQFGDFDFKTKTT